MLDNRIHFRTNFRISKSAIADNYELFQILINISGNWLKKQFLGTGKEQFIFKPWLYKGGALIGDGIKCETRTKDYSEESRRAEVWLMRIEKNDSVFPQRIWRTDVGYSNISDSEADVTVTVYWRLRNDFLGEEPPIPSASSPNIVKWLVENDSINSSISQHRLSSKAIKLRVGDGRKLHQFLMSETREIPMILINIRTYFNTIIPDGLQNLLIGSAIVYYYDDLIVHQELQQEWGDTAVGHYQCSPDSVRIYQTKINQSTNFDWKRHRYFLLKDYEDKKSNLLRLLVQSLLRLNAQKSREAIIYDFEGLELLIQSERLKGLKQAVVSAENDSAGRDYIEALEQDNVRLNKEKIELINTIELNEEDGVFKDITIEDLEHKYEQLQLQFAEITNNQQHITAGIKAMADIRVRWKKLPENVLDLLSLAALLYPDKLVVLEEAKTSARECDFSHLSEIWNLISSVVDDLHALHFENIGGNIEALFQQRSGFGISLKEGSQTKNDNSLMSIRKRQYGSKEIDISAHIKIDKGNKFFRFHYYPDHERKLIVIGHFGNHLQTAGSQRRGQR